MNKNVVIGIVVVIALAGGYFIYRNSKSSSVANTMQENTTSVVDTTATTTSALATTTPVVVKEFTVSGKDFSFDPKTISVKKGDTVKIIFKDTQGFHDFKIDEFNVASKRLKDVGEDTLQFVADKTGSFEYYCSVGSHRAMGMKGTLTVTE